MFFPALRQISGSENAQQIFRLLGKRNSSNCQINERISVDYFFNLHHSIAKISTPSNVTFHNQKLQRFDPKETNKNFHALFSSRIGFLAHNKNPDAVIPPSKT